MFTIYTKSFVENDHPKNVAKYRSDSNFIELLK